METGKKGNRMEVVRSSVVLFAFYYGLDTRKHRSVAVVFLSESNGKKEQDRVY